MRLSEKYIAILEQRKTELENYLKENIREIELPEQVAISTRSDDQRSQSVRISCILLGAGALMAIGGMVSGKPLLTIGGFAMAGVGAVSHVKATVLTSQSYNKRLKIIAALRVKCTVLCHPFKHICLKDGMIVRQLSKPRLSQTLTD